MCRQELGLVLDWADREGWNPGLKDSDCFHAADNDGFLICCLGQEPVACISSVSYGENYGFIGFYIVKPELRGRGYGRRIWQAGMKKLGDRVIGLDGVPPSRTTIKTQDLCSLIETYGSVERPSLHQFGTQNSLKSTSRGSSQ